MCCLSIVLQATLSPIHVFLQILMGQVYLFRSHSLRTRRHARNQVGSSRSQIESNAYCLRLLLLPSRTPLKQHLAKSGRKDFLEGYGGGSVAPVTNRHLCIT